MSFFFLKNAFISCKKLYCTVKKFTHPPHPPNNGDGRVAVAGSAHAAYAIGSISAAHGVRCGYPIVGGAGWRRAAACKVLFKRLKKHMQQVDPLQPLGP